MAGTTRLHRVRRRARSALPQLLIGGWLLAARLSACSAEIHVSPVGNDGNPGTATQPLRTLTAAQQAARKRAGKEPVKVVLQSGVYYLADTVVFTVADSGTETAPVIYGAAPGASPLLSGGSRLDLRWEPHRGGILQASVPAQPALDQLFVNGRCQSMARFPNAVPGKSIFDVWELGENAAPAEDPLAPERLARWRDPRGGYLHAMHRHLWGDQHWVIEGVQPDGSLRLRGGWQNNRPSPPHPQYRFVENIAEELDVPGEWYHDRQAGVLYLYPERGMDLRQATVETVRLARLIEFRGSRLNPVRWIELTGLTFVHTTRVFMENREPLLRSDWTVAREGAVFCEGAEDCVLSDCTFEQVGGNAVFVNNYNRRILVRGCLIRESGANGVAFVGNPQAVRSPLFNYDAPMRYADLDRTPGPQGDDFPADCRVEDCLITRSGRVEKQTAPVAISMAQSITVRHCSIYDVPRAGINIGDGCWGGHVVEFCDVFDTVKETGDHGSFNSWGRDRFWNRDPAAINQAVAADPTLPFLDVRRPIVLRYNRWRCDHGWDVDLDDGSSNYEIHHNLMLHGGLKLREGYRRIATHNILVNNSLHPHVWLWRSGDVFKHNIVMGAYRPAGGLPKGKLGQEIDFNLFTSSEADRLRFAGGDCDAHSLVGDPRFVEPTTGDFRVQAGSPALVIGFQNFPMNQFGVLKPALRKLARTPPISRLSIQPITAPPPDLLFAWRGATLKNLAGLEYSAVGVAVDHPGGAYFIEVPEDTDAFKAGLRSNDLVTRSGGMEITGVQEFSSALAQAPAGVPLPVTIWRNQTETPLSLPPPFPRPAKK